MNFHDITTALWEAKNTLDAADQKADHMAQLLLGRLRHVSVWKLQELKKELTNFNARTGEWK